VTGFARGDRRGAIAPECARALVAVAALALSACAGSPPPPDAFHRLHVPDPPARATPLLDGVVEVDRLATVDVLRSRPLAVVDAATGVLRHARYDLWVSGPPALVQDALVDYLRAARAAERVVVPELRDEPRWIVAGRLHRFERVAGGGGAAAVSLELSLRPAGGGPPRVHGVYAVERPASADSAAAAIEALGVATGEAFARFLADVEAAQPRP
jgi:ABC-type uncharacterized transport system auxiliary subunit